MAWKSLLQLLLLQGRRLLQSLLIIAQALQLLLQRRLVGGRQRQLQLLQQLLLQQLAVAGLLAGSRPRGFSHLLPGLVQRCLLHHLQISMAEILALMLATGYEVLSGSRLRQVAGASTYPLLVRRRPQRAAFFHQIGRLQEARARLEARAPGCEGNQRAGRTQARLGAEYQIVVDCERAFLPKDPVHRQRLCRRQPQNGFAACRLAFEVRMRTAAQILRGLFRQMHPALAPSEISKAPTSISLLRAAGAPSRLVLMA